MTRAAAIVAAPALVLGALDWPPRIDVDRRVRIYVPDDRARYLAGQPVPTAHVFGPRGRR